MSGHNVFADGLPPIVLETYLCHQQRCFYERRKTNHVGMALHKEKWHVSLPVGGVENS